MSIQQANNEPNIIETENRLFDHEQCSIYATNTTMECLMRKTVTSWPTGSVPWI